MKSSAAASLHTSGSIDSLSLPPPMSQIEKVTSCCCSRTVRSMKLTPCVGSCVSSYSFSTYRTISDVLPTFASPSSAILMSGGGAGAEADAADGPATEVEREERMGFGREGGGGGGESRRAATMELALEIRDARAALLRSPR